ncbi:unnamed protein product [Scytosiphon promiscuus]
MIAVGDERAESRSTGGVLPSYCVESPAVPGIRPSTLSPAATVCKDDDVMSGKSAPEFKLSQCFGDCSPAEEATQADILSAVNFDQSGEYFATGDRGGRVVIFKKSEGEPKMHSCGKTRRSSDYKFFTEFQSHEAEFDYLKSLEIEEKINAIKWCPRVNDALFLLATNDKTVKLWKIREKQMKRVITPASNAVKEGIRHAKRGLALPQISSAGTAVATTLRRVFANAHTYHVNSVDPNSDGEHFISADDLRINMWNLEITDRSFNILDMKPKSMEELTEVITAATFHPSHCSVFLYSSSRGCIKMGDMRASALCDKHAKVLEKPVESSAQSFFSEIVASISDIKSTSDGRYIISRDYMTLKLWDVNMEARPVKTINVHEHLRPQLCHLYENDCIFDKFECAVSGDASNVLTGSYSNICNMYDRYGQATTSLEVCKDPSTKAGKKAKRRLARNPGLLQEGGGEIDYEKKILHMSWHPQQDIIAVAGHDKLYIYTA